MRVGADGLPSHRLGLRARNLEDADGIAGGEGGVLDKEHEAPGVVPLVQDILGLGDGLRRPFGEVIDEIAQLGPGRRGQTEAEGQKQAGKDSHYIPPKPPQYRTIPFSPATAHPPPRRLMLGDLAAEPRSISR